MPIILSTVVRAGIGQLNRDDVEDFMMAIHCVDT